MVPPQCSHRDRRAGAAAPSLERPQAMQYTRNSLRAAFRAAARCSADGSPINSSEAGSDLRDRAPDSSVAHSAIMRQSSRPWTEVPFRRSRAASPATTQRISSSQRICSRSVPSGDLYRNVLAFCEGAVSRVGTAYSIRAVVRACGDCERSHPGVPARQEPARAVGHCRACAHRGQATQNCFESSRLEISVEFAHRSSATHPPGVRAFDSELATRFQTECFRFHAYRYHR
jgi:hypothetical protein